MLNTFKATVSVLKILFPKVTITAPALRNSSISARSIPPSGPTNIAIFIFSLSLLFIDFNSDAIYGISLLFLVMISLIFVICPIIDCIYDISWYIKYKKSLKSEEVIVYPTLKRLNIKITYTNLYIITFIITILTLIRSLSEISMYISFLLSFIIAIIFLGKIVKIAIS